MIFGGAASAAADLGRQLSGCKPINWSSIGASALFGAVTGGVTGATWLTGVIDVEAGFTAGSAYGVFVDDPYNAVHYPW